MGNSIFDDTVRSAADHTYLIMRHHVVMLYLITILSENTVLLAELTVFAIVGSRLARICELAIRQYTSKLWVPCRDLEGM